MTNGAMTTLEARWREHLVEFREHRLDETLLSWQDIPRQLTFESPWDRGNDFTLRRILVERETAKPAKTRKQAELAGCFTTRSGAAECLRPLGHEGRCRYPNAGDVDTAKSLSRVALARLIDEQITNGLERPHVLEPEHPDMFIIVSPGEIVATRLRGVDSNASGEIPTAMPTKASDEWVSRDQGWTWAKRHAHRTGAGPWRN